jgi:hypothetical protein
MGKGHALRLVLPGRFPGRGRGRAEPARVVVLDPRHDGPLRTRRKSREGGLGGGSRDAGARRNLVPQRAGAEAAFTGVATVRDDVMPARVGDRAGTKRRHIGETKLNRGCAGKRGQRHQQSNQGGGSRHGTSPHPPSGCSWRRSGAARQLLRRLTINLSIELGGRHGHPPGSRRSTSDAPRAARSDFSPGPRDNARRGLAGMPVLRWPARASSLD